MHSPNYSYYILLNNKLILSSLLCFTFNFYGYAQDKEEIQIANEYLLKGDKAKALSVFESLAKKTINIPFIHNNYLDLLIDLGMYKEAEDYMQKLVRKSDNQIVYPIDLGRVYLKTGSAQKADKQFREVIKINVGDIYKIKSVSDYFASHRLTDYAVMALQESRKVKASRTLFTLELANLYRLQGNRDNMVEEYLNYVTQTPGNINYVKNLLQVLLTKPEEMESLERLLYDRVQQSPESQVYADLLIWINVQQRNFYGAFIQARAYDKRFKGEDLKTLEIAQIALSNEDYENADKGFSYVMKEYARTDHYLPARLGRIRAQEAKVKRKIPINKDSVKYLVGEYQSFIESYPQDVNAHEAQLNQSILYAYHLDEKDAAIEKLEALISNQHVAPYMKAKAKLEMGDIYMLKEEPWESTLLYSQVERAQREAPMGYQAKLRNAKLSYYKGNFALAQEHLDILKEATTREIANDAMELSIRIKENTAVDSTGAALKVYAAIELLLYQNKTEEALNRMVELKDGDSGGKGSIAIRDDVYWLEANIRLKLGQFEQAQALLKKINEEFEEDILADDAYFLQGEIFERHLKDKDKAMEIYREFLNRYPGSVYAAEARKRYRLLRGDFSVLEVDPKF